MKVRSTSSFFLAALLISTSAAQNQHAIPDKFNEATVAQLQAEMSSNLVSPFPQLGDVAEYPGSKHDKFETTYRHKHQNSSRPTCPSCRRKNLALIQDGLWRAARAGERTDG